jgi:centractin
VYNREEDYIEESKNFSSTYTLPDGQQIRIGAEKFRAPEILFSPERIGLEYPGVQELLINSINRADLDLRRALYNSIFLAGGSSMIAGFPDRLLNDLRRL